jgi:hypothetical protein
MISLVVVPEPTRMTIEVPADIVHKRFHAGIYEDEGLVSGEYVLPEPDPDKLAEVIAFCTTMRKDLRDFRFDGDEKPISKGRNRIWTKG